MASLGRLRSTHAQMMVTAYLLCLCRPPHALRCGWRSITARDRRLYERPTYDTSTNNAPPLSANHKSYHRVSIPVYLSRSLHHSRPNSTAFSLPLFPPSTLILKNNTQAATIAHATTVNTTCVPQPLCTSACLREYRLTVLM